MRRLDVKKPLNLLIVVCFVVLMSANVVGHVSADVGYEPYFKTTGADDFAGGWFANGNSCSTTGNYQAATYGGSVGSKFSGAILGFAAPSGASRNGAVSELGAFGLGLIEGPYGPAANASANFGFKTGIATASFANSPLSFANVIPLGSDPTFWGGYFDGNNNRLPRCIPDYAAKEKATATPWNGDLNQNDNLQHTYAGDTIGGGTINAGTKLTIFAKGDIYITGNIIYNPAHDETNIPKFVLVAQGNIYISPNVTQLDGWYIAQPKNPSAAATVTDNTTGVIWSCFDRNWPARTPTLPPKDTMVRRDCTQPLVVNGALTAKQINFIRVSNATGVPSGIAGSPAEVVNYTPEMVMGGAFFNAPPPTGGGIQSLISLPPVF